MDIESTINRLVRQCGTSDPFAICEARNILIIERPLGSICGFHQYALRQHIIYLNDGLDEHWRRFTCAHELGHVILHPRVSTPFLLKNTLYSVGRIERQANRFAALLLSYGAEPVDGLTVAEACAAYGIPVKFRDAMLA